MMGIDEFRELLDAHGPELALWPEQDRAGAQALIDASPEARQALGEAERLDGLLARSLRPERADETLRAAILRIPVDHPQPRPAGGWAWLAALAGPWRIGMTAAAASVLLGLAVGFTDVAPGIARGINGMETADLSALVYGDRFDADMLL